jgi:type IV pilus assembly protein PilC
MIIIGVLMLIYVVPTLTATFTDLKVPLPATTRFIIFISDTLKNHTLIIVALVAILFALSYTAAKTRQGKRFFDFLVLHLPIIGTLVRETNSARTARTLSSLLISGVEVVNAIDITKDVLQNSYYKEVLSRSAAVIQKGEPLSGVFIASEKFYPPFVGEMISVGEETGKLSEMLYRVAVYYEADVEQKTKDMSTIIEPFLMVIIGAAVGFFAISMISPTYSLVGSI